MARELDWKADAGICVRTPLLPLTTLIEWAAAPDPRAFLADLLALREVDEALFVASPNLHATKAVSNPRLETALVKYVARMCGRATPFGLFSGISTGTLGAKTSIELAPRSEYRRRTRLDNDYLFVLCDELLRDPEVRERVTLRPNTSIYRIAGRLRYAAAKLDGKERNYHLVSVTPTPYLDATLARARSGAKLGELVTPLVDGEITLDEARTYVGELIDAQLLVPDLGVHITGPEPIDGLIAQLAAAGLDAQREKLEHVRAALAAIDAGGLTNAPASYLAIAASLEALPAKVDLSKLFQVDMLKPANITLGNRVVADLVKAITALSRVSKGAEAPTLAEFRRAFTERWEDQEVPLADVLDEESGIGFERARGPGSEGSPLLARLGFPPGKSEQRMVVRALDALLLRKLAQGGEITLDPKELDAIADGDPAHLPHAFSTMVRVAGTDGELDVMFDGTNGPSGARILGRFCHLSAELDAMTRAHHAAEEAMRPDAIFAEIVHLNEGRIGNILCRPVLRTYEIVYLGMSGAPVEHQLTLDDLLISVRGNRIVLRSRRLGREVIPRLSTAHNYRLRSLGVYRFLCALASQGTEGVGFSWGPLGDAPYLPRVKIGRVVVSRAQWKLHADELKDLSAAVKAAGKAKPGEGRAAVEQAVSALRTKHQLPRFLMVAAGDNELPIDLDNPLLVAAFADELAGAPRVTLIEMFPAPDQLVARGPEGAFANEIVITFTRKVSAVASDERRAPPASRRTFAPGSEWLYAKIYCGESTADRVLCELAPVIRDAGAKWFFIRYADPDPHVRLRFHGDPAHLLGSVLPALERVITPLIDQGIARRLVLDTYQRETERYGGDRGIELVEQLFQLDSECVLGIVELLDGDAGADARWRLALRGIDSMLDAIGLTPDERMQVMTFGRDMIGNEHHADAAFWGRIGERFLKERASLDQLFARDRAADAEHDLEPGFELLATRDAAIRELAVELRRRDAANELAPKLGDFAWSLVHMHANRLLHASQRAQEMVLYDFLRRLHQSRKARAKA